MFKVNNKKDQNDVIDIILMFLLFLLLTCVYQEVRNVSFSENFAYVLNGWLHRLK